MFLPPPGIAVAVLVGIGICAGAGVQPTGLEARFGWAATVTTGPAFTAVLAAGGDISPGGGARYQPRGRQQRAIGEIGPNRARGDPGIEATNGS